MAEKTINRFESQGFGAHRSLEMCVFSHIERNLYRMVASKRSPATFASDAWTLSTRLSVSVASGSR
jgi:hypothetical protein